MQHDAVPGPSIRPRLAAGAQRRPTPGTIPRICELSCIRRLLDLLVRATRFAVEQQEMAAAMQSLTLTDELTGLHNRRGFMALARQQLRLARRNGRHLTLIFCDVDGLKQINDRFGHVIGDRALRGAATVLRKTLRDSDVVARIGGDEFAAMANDAPDRSKRSIEARLQQNLETYNLRCPQVPVSMSVGVATVHPGQALSLEELMRLADQAMYARKCAAADASRADRTGPDTGAREVAN